jgi:glycosyltransferase involved in cell wall biosynthesis
MRVAFFSSYPPENDGIAKYTKRLIENFPKEIEATVFAMDGKFLPDARGVSRSLSFRLKDIAETYKRLMSLSPCIIHVQYTIPLFGFYNIFLWPLAWTCKFAKKSKLAITLHEVKRETDRLRIIGRFYFYFLSAFTDRIYVHTLEAKNILIQKCRVEERKVRIIPHGSYSFKSTASKEDQIREMHDIRKSDIILFFGYIHVDKGLEYLVEAFSQLLQKNPTLKKTTELLIAGSVRPRKGILRIFGAQDEKYLEKIKDQIGKLDLSDNIKLIDYVPEELVYSYFKMSACAVLPYTNAEQSGVLNEAISTRTPVIASNIGGIGETLKDVGILVEPRDSKAIAFSLEKIIGNKEYAQKISESYNELNKKLQTSEIVNMLIEDYKSIE